MYYKALRSNTHVQSSCRIQNQYKNLVAFTYTNVLSDKEMRKYILFKITSKKIKYLGKHLPKDEKDHYNERNR